MLFTGGKLFISGRNFWGHHCCGEKPTRVNPVAMLREPHTEQDFGTDILSRFRNNAHGEICRTNRIIQHVGYRHYCLRKSQTSKQVEARKIVMQEKRELARPLIKLQYPPSCHGSGEVFAQFCREALPWQGSVPGWPAICHTCQGIVSGATGLYLQGDRSVLSGRHRG